MSALSFPRHVRLSARQRNWVPALLGAAVLGAACARIAISTRYGKGAIEALIALPVLVYVFRRPAIALLVLLAVASSLFAYANLPRVSLPGHPPINVADLLLGVAVAGTLWRRPWRSWPPVAKYYLGALGIMLAISSVATVKTLTLGHTQSRDALYDFRNWLYLFTALTVALELRGELWWRFLDGAIVLGAIVSIFALAAAASASVQHFLLSLSPVSVYSASATSAADGVNIGGIARIRVQGLFFVYWMVIPTLMLVLTDRHRRVFRSAGLLLMVAAVAVSLNRNMYAGTLVGILVAALLGGMRIRARLAMTVLAALTTLVLVFLTSVSPAITSQIGKRAGTVLSPSQVLHSNSAIDRSYELTYALPSIARRPWFGVGPRQGYGALLSPYADNPRFFVQDLYVWLATDYGIPTALAFLLIPGVCVWFGITRVRAGIGQRQRGLLAALIGSLVAMMLSSAVDVFLQDPSSTVAFGLACGGILAVGLETYPIGTDTRAIDGARTSGA